MVLRALEQGLSCNWLRLKALETGHQHVLELLPRRNCPWPKGTIPSLSHVPDFHAKDLAMTATLPSYEDIVAS